MNKQQITEGNKLIAEFMSKENPFHDGRYIVFNGFAYTPDEMKFNSSWDWIMPVVEKIEEMGFNVTMRGISCSVSRLCEDETIVQLDLGDRSQKMDLAYCVVVEFIKWYNQQK